jgi:phosphatidylinositol alpha-mannosyltransferase
MGLRIALTHAFCWPEVRRGGERYLHELAGALARRGHSVTIVAGARMPSLASRDGVRVVRIPRGRPEPALSAERRFGALVIPALAAGRFDVVHSLGARDGAASIRVRDTIGRHRTVYTNLGNPVRSWWDTRPDRRAHQRVVDEIDVYGCLSEYGRGFLRRDYGRDGVLTPGGVDLQRFRPGAERADTPTLLYSGVLDDPRKGVALLLEAVAILSRTEPRVRLWLSGPGDASKLLAAAPAAARERTDVLPIGRPEDQPARYASAWATVLASRGEAFGLVLVESLACGTPIVATDDGGLPELISPGAGVLAPIEDPPALARACAEALALGAESDSRERCRSAAQRHDWDGSVAPAVEALYLGAGRDARAG